MELGVLSEGILRVLGAGLARVQGGLKQPSVPQAFGTCAIRFGQERHKRCMEHGLSRLCAFSARNGAPIRLPFQRPLLALLL